MDERKSKRPQADDVPIIGDYSAAQNERLRATGPRVSEAVESRAPEGTVPAASVPPPQRLERKRGDDRLVLDPRDMHRYQRRASERERKGRPAKLLWYAAVPATLIVAGLVYGNFDSLRGMSIGFALPSGSFGRGAGAGAGGETRSDAESEPVAVEAPVVVGEDAPLDSGAEVAGRAVEAASPPAPVAEPPSSPLEPQPEPNAAPSDAAPAGAVAADAAEPAVAETAPLGVTEPAQPQPEAPVEPETFEFGTAVTNVSEADPAAAVLLLRHGGRRAESWVTWWTTPGTATAGVDYADLGTVELRFPAGAQNRTIRIPLVGDRVAEGLETFYVHVAVGDAAEEVARVEVVINDDD